jgi:MoaA/NifB/PqqE/SkfB family radical SAM enzyme
MIKDLARTAYRSAKRGFWKTRQALSTKRFDEAFYVATNGDVETAVRRGWCSTPFEHYVRYGVKEGRTPFYVHRSIDELVYAPTTELVFLELTTRCNLRCVYCAVSQPTYNGIDLPLESFDTFIAHMKARGVKTVSMNGHGESTIVKGWENYANQLADAGLELHITSNFAKRLTESEIEAFARFEMVLVSLDTVDPELLGKLRRGARLQVILDNISIVSERVAAAGRKPNIAISCVMSDLAAPTVLELAEELLKRGVRTFRFGDLSEYPAIPGVLTARHVSNLHDEALEKARASFRAAVQLIDQTPGTELFIDAPLTAFLLEPQNQPHEVVENQERAEDVAKKNVHFTAVEEKQTRDCLDPWKIAFVQASAEIRPCCFFEETIGSLQKNSLEEIFNGDEYKKLRLELLTGDLRPNCETCNSRETISREAFEQKARNYVESEARRKAAL